MSQSMNEMNTYSPSTVKRGHVELRPVAEYLPFVRKVALRIARRLPTHVRIDDLVGAGVVGLLEAMERFDPERVKDFETYAEFRVKGAMLDELRSRDLMARDARMEAKRIERSMCDLRQELGHEPEEHDVATHLGMDVETLRKKLSKLTPVRVLSMSDAVGGEPAGDHKTPFDEVARAQLIEKLTVCIGELTQRQQQVLHLYYREELTLREIGEVLGVTESRVCQIVSEVTLRLRAMLGEGDERPVKKRRRRRRRSHG